MSEATQQEEQSVSLPADERRIARGVAIGLPIASVAIALVVGLVLGVPMAVLVLAAGTLLGVIALLWASLRVLSGDAPLPPELEALDAAAHGVDALSSRKKMLLRAIKDLDNERALGKLEDDDYEQVASSYRNDLKDVMRKIDASLEPFRAKAEALAKEHLEKAVMVGDVKVKLEDIAKAQLEGSEVVEGENAKGEKVEVVTAVRLVCASCEASNEPDAKFCKGCGATLAKQEDADDEA